MRRLIPVVSLLLLAVPANAADINAASCSSTDVQNAIDSAIAGDRVLVPAGNCTWTFTVIIAAGQDITLQGAGIGQTIINNAGLTVNRAAVRITGFEFQDPDIEMRAQNWRIDHNKLENSSSVAAILATNRTTDEVPPWPGLVDHNEFIRGRVVVFATQADIDKQHFVWRQARPHGGPNFVFVEDNTFDANGVNGNMVDANRAGRYVFRFNTHSGPKNIEMHSMQGCNTRATHAWEVYGNTLDNPDTPWFVAFLVRGGTGMIFDNTVTGNYTEMVGMDNVRSFVDVGGTCGACDGNSSVDGNTPGEFGWACRDQIGRGQDDPGTYPTPQASDPAYYWQNTFNGSPRDPTVRQCGDGIKPGQSCADIVQNRDYYDEDTPFDGTTGVGVGTIANRPATCTTGVGYWATEEGEWNSRQAGPDGQLYRCTATDTWTLYYTPFTYPHPMQSGAVVRPLPPTNLGVVVR
jgi:hypothetical protein